MKSGYEYHSRFIFADRDKIQDAINQNIINENDIVICKDTKEFIYIDNNFNLVTVKSRVHRYTSVEQAIEELNKNADTYASQIVAILDTRGHYQGYMVNQDNNGKYIVEPISITESTKVDYDNLGNRPIINIAGDIGNPVVLDIQADGIYRVTGNYKISNYYETTFSSFNNSLFIVRHDDDGNIYVKEIGSDITDYHIDTDGNVVISVVPTTQWLSDQGYVTESYVDKKIAALDFITQEEIENYVQNVVLQTIDKNVQETIDAKIQENFKAVTQEEALEVFVDIFEK